MNINVDINENLMGQNVIQINGGITINVDVSVKKNIVQNKNIYYHFTTQNENKSILIIQIENE